jgi:hypothetical protein
LESAIATVDTVVDAIKLKTDEPGTSTGTIVQDGATGAPDCIMVIGGAGDNVFGSWTQLDAAVATDVWISHITVLPYNTSSDFVSYCLEIGTGASPVTKIRFSFRGEKLLNSNTTLLPIIFSLPKPIKVLSGTKISARLSTDDYEAGGCCHVGTSYYTGL